MLGIRESAAMYAVPSLEHRASAFLAAKAAWLPACCSGLEGVVSAPHGHRVVLGVTEPDRAPAQSARPGGARPAAFRVAACSSKVSKSTVQQKGVPTSAMARPSTDPVPSPCLVHAPVALPNAPSLRDGGRMLGHSADSASALRSFLSRLYQGFQNSHCSLLSALCSLLSALSLSPVAVLLRLPPAPSRSRLVVEHIPATLPEPCCQSLGLSTAAAEVSRTSLARLSFRPSPFLLGQCGGLLHEREDRAGDGRNTGMEPAPLHCAKTCPRHFFSQLIVA